MFKKVALENFGPIPILKWDGLANINLVIGANATGKTFLLKLMYAVHKSLEEFGRGNDQRGLDEILSSRLFWTFQESKIGNLVQRGKPSIKADLAFTDQGHLRFEFGKDVQKKIPIINNSIVASSRPFQNHAIFLPAKEVLSLQHVILKSRDQDSVFGFDDTYVDLARVLTQPPTRGRNLDEFASARKRLAKELHGKLKFDDQQKLWRFQNNQNQLFEIGATAEGIKKLAILDVLLGNRYLDKNSVVFIDEPETALHPSAIIHFLETISELSKLGMQFCLATHSYFVIKKLFLIAQQQKCSIPTLIFGPESGITQADLRDDMPENSIIDESVRLYEQQLELV